MHQTSSSVKTKDTTWQNFNESDASVLKTLKQKFQLQIYIYIQGDSGGNVITVGDNNIGECEKKMFI